MKGLINAIGVTLLLVTAGWAFAVGKININTADAETLATLKGVGQSKAEAIVEYRQQNGSFESVGALANVKGIGQKIIDSNLDSLTVGDQKTQ